MKQKTTLHWLTVAASCGLFASSIGICTNSMAVFYGPVSEALGVGRGTFALSITISALVSGFFSPVVAKWMGSHPLRPMLLFGVLLNAAVTLSMAWAGNIWLFYGLGVLRGIGMSCFSLMPVTTIIGSWFETRHGLAMGIAMSFSGLSGAVFNPIFSAIIESAGYRQAYICMAVFSLILALPGALFLRLRPQEFSLLPYGADRDVPAPDLPKVSEKKSGGAVWACLPFVVLALLAVLQNFITGVAQHFPGYAETVGLTAGVGAMMVSAGMVGNIVSKLIIGVLSDRFGPFMASAVMMSVNAIALGVLALLPKGAFPLALGAAFFYGAVYSITAAGISLITRRIFGMERYAAAYSAVTIMTSIGNAVSLTIIGTIYDVTGTYLSAILVSLLADGISLLALFYLARKVKNGGVRA